MILGTPNTPMDRFKVWSDTGTSELVAYNEAVSYTSNALTARVKGRKSDLVVQPASHVALRRGSPVVDTGGIPTLNRLVRSYRKQERKGRRKEKAFINLDTMTFIVWTPKHMIQTNYTLINHKHEQIKEKIFFSMNFQKSQFDC